ncbi:MAG: hypothetical protein JWP97_6102 [Labilithrix sp.]|nr:hypothetical protein [Labilithrix sp.]
MSAGKLSLSPAFLVASACVVAGAIGGYVCDVAPARPVVHRAGYRVLEGDFHAHTAWSDGSLSPLGVVRQANRRGLDVIAITEHNTVWPSRFAQAYAPADQPLVLTGQEVTTARFHVIAIGIEHTVSPDQPLDDVIDAIHAQHGVAIIAHPVPLYWPHILASRERFDAAEVVHPIAFSETSGAWSYAEMVRFSREAKGPLGAIGSSDYHWMSVLGLCRTLVFVTEPVTQASVVEAIRAHRTVTVGPDGTAYGDAASIAALEREPIAPRAPDYEYRGSGVADRVLRAIGWMGLLGVVLLRARRKA